MRIGIDLMGSDSSPSILFKAALSAYQQLTDKQPEFLLFADPSSIRSLPKENLKDNFRFEIADEVISMEDDPLTAVRLKKKSSMICGIQKIKAGGLDAFVTAGNTGALIASSAIFLPLFFKLQRPALVAFLPSSIGSFAMLDVGGTVSGTADHLVQLAKLGAAYLRILCGLSAPRVGLLNIGVETKKGRMEIQSAHQRLKKIEGDQLTFVGNVEPRDLFFGQVDLLVTDGFSGNILLKTAEGLSAFIFDFLRQKLKQYPEELLDLQRPFSYNEYPGALVLGVEGIVVKCHGNTSVSMMTKSILLAADLFEKQLINQVEKDFRMHP